MSRTWILAFVGIVGLGSLGLGAAEAGAETIADQAPSAKWIWTGAKAVENAPKETVFFRRAVTLPAAPKRAEIITTVDNQLQLSVNGREAIRSDTWETPTKVDIAPLLRPGQNVLAVVAANTAPSPAGFLLVGRVETQTGRAIDISTDKRWLCASSKVAGWDTATFSGEGFSPAAELTDITGGPWAIAARLAKAESGPVFRSSAYWDNRRKRQREALAQLVRPFEPGRPADRAVIDRFMTATWKRNEQVPAPVCDDRTFLRRVSLDIIGLGPSPEAIAAFLAEASPNKRAALVDALLADNQAYAEHWMTFWCDLLRNDEQTSIDGLRKPITAWLYTALLQDTPYDIFVANLLDPGPGGPDGYLRGVQWRGAVSASQIPPIQAAQNVGQVMMATPVKCASCHDSFIDEWMLKDAYGLAAFFSEKNLTLHKCDSPTDEVVAPKFLFPELGDVAPDADLATRHRRAAELVTHPANPRFAKTIVNRIWHRLNGWALFEPIDTFDGGGEHGPLLAWLADDFMRHDFALKHLIRRIVLTRTYQRASVGVPQEENADTKSKIVGPPIRRLTAEQILDAMASVTGYWPKRDTVSASVDNPNIRAWRHKVPTALARALGRPHREQAITERDAEPTVLRTLELVNGRIFSGYLLEGAQTLLESPLGKETDAAKVVHALVERSTARKASDEELALLTPLVGAPTDDPAERAANWQDVLWILFMSPDFQFIR